MIEMLQSLNPATGEVVWQGPVADAAGAADAVARARAACPGWARLPVEHRIAMARAYAGVLEARREDLALLIARETGKLLWEARTEVAAMIGKVDISIRAQAERTGVSAGAMRRTSALDSFTAARLACSAASSWICSGRKSVL